MKGYKMQKQNKIMKKVIIGVETIRGNWWITDQDGEEVAGFETIEDCFHELSKIGISVWEKPKRVMQRYYEFEITKEQEKKFDEFHLNQAFN